ncbi:O-antigen biosynthesis protein WbqP [Weissella uvarum]|uniref:sugar transferase n=1 Tax=Weissella uvarum TaxID=1479233 RepID=UPI0019614498|nr:sugar transferase [Weissella uvarum]MBM7617118.1 O-antigen biosynthesis protein WbqP [Weissella uvarum]MCM0595414.1 sugar transferase [Weissella uvarum]
MFYRKFGKRALDIVGAIGLLTIFGLPMLLIALMVRLTSHGPVLFRQKRYTVDSRPFKVYKYRSMVPDAPERANQRFDDMDNYLTTIGKLLRRTSLDEMPQLLNVLKGDMSFIGPRPLADSDYRVIDLRKMNGADQVRPGISGLAQVNGRNNISDEQKAAYDQEYAEHVSFMLDLKIVLKTIGKVFRQSDIDRDEERDVNVVRHVK